MKIVISPAKSLNFEKKLPINHGTFVLKQSRQIQQVLKQSQTIYH
jgi:cytoplasmic iron level regulating protein YaaA (DUF328/UPF0246 family)